jgi:hypothetical protein
MNSRRRTQPVAALVYADNAYPDAAFDALVRQCRSQGLSLAGVLDRVHLDISCPIPVSSREFRRVYFPRYSPVALFATASAISRG